MRAMRVTMYAHSAAQLAYVLLGGNSPETRDVVAAERP